MYSTLKRILIGPPIAVVRGAPPAAHQDHRLGGVRLRRHLVDGLRDRGDPARPGPARRRGRRLRATWCRSRSSSSSCWPSWSPATARRSSPTRAAAGRTSCRKENLGMTPSLVAGSSLLVDYILTVAVSISGGRGRHHVGVPGVAAVPGRASASGSSSCMTLANLRGVKESGASSPVPPTSTSCSLLALIGSGLPACTSATSGRMPGQRTALDDARRQRHDARPASRSSCCCGRSRRVPSRSPGSRRSRTACPRSASPSRRTPPTTLDVDGPHPRRLLLRASRARPPPEADLDRRTARPCCRSWAGRLRRRHARSTTSCRSPPSRS